MQYAYVYKTSGASFVYDGVVFLFFNVASSVRFSVDFDGFTGLIDETWQASSLIMLRTYSLVVGGYF